MMGTKNNPGDFDCYANAEPDEPMFVLLGRDPTAGFVVMFWKALKEKMVQSGHSNSSPEKLAEAERCAEKMKEWAKSKGKDTDQVVRAMMEILVDMPTTVGEKSDDRT